jgi:HK97 family phage major capsid protein
MKLRQLIIGNKIAALRVQLTTLRTAEDAFATRAAALDTREAELTAALGEVTPDTAEEDRQTVEDAVTTLETERAALDAEQATHAQQVASIEEQIRTLQQELDDLNARASTPAVPTAQAPTIEREDDSPMKTRNRFFGMTIQERDAFLARQEVRDFLQRVRDFGGQKRAVSGAELNIPDTVLPIIRENIDQYSKLIGKVAFKAIKGTARQNVAGRVPEAVWTEMKGKINELGISFSQVAVDGYKVAGYIPISNSVLEDSDIALATEILTAIGQAIGYALDKAMVYGTGIKMPLGIVTRLAQTAKPADYADNARAWEDLHTKNVLAVRGGTSGSYTELTGIDLFKGIAKAAKAAKGKYSRGMKVWLMSESTHQTINIEAMSINAAGAIVSGINGSMPVIGGEIIELDFIPDGEIVFGYADEYLLVERKGIALAMSEHVMFLEDMTLYKGTARYDGLPVIAEGFVAIAIDAGTPTTSVTFATDAANA